MRETQSVMRGNLKKIWLGLFFVLFARCSAAVAQTSSTTDNSGPLDTLYAQSHLLAFPYADWPYSYVNDPVFTTDADVSSLSNETLRSLRELRLGDTDLEFPDKRSSESSSATSDPAKG